MFSHKLFVYKIAKFFGKKTAIYSQSVGPFDKRGENIMKRYIPYLDTLLVRDAFSHDLTKNIFTYEQMKKVIKTEDAAFLLDYSKRESPKTKKIAVSVRSWNKDGRDSEAYRVLIKSFCVFVLEKGYKIDFLSTCQGLPNYVDDSIEAREIISSIPPQHSNNIVLDDHWYDVNELQRKLREYSFVIGTRLHMCILSLLNDVPAFNISYEIKGLECYTYLKMEKYSVDYNEDVSTALKKLKDFVENNNVISDHISDQIPFMHLQAEKHYATFLKKLEIHSALREANPKVNM